MTFLLDPPAAAAVSNPLLGLVPPNLDLWALRRSERASLSDPLNSAMQTLQTMEAMNVHGSLASSIESLSNINQDLHLKLQQQRMATMMFGGDSQKGESSVALNGFGNQKLLQPLDPPAAAAVSNPLLGLVPPNPDLWALRRSERASLSDPLNSAMQTLQTMEAMNVHGSLASSIESLSNINQDLHLKLQQQRMATMMFGGDSQKVVGSPEVAERRRNSDDGSATAAVAAAAREAVAVAARICREK
ncbi:hypothetical protein DEO72_LG3g1985 [Vigna unguiculata]|uniref:Uncharacterized protein n=1 Tax=Vigna unguiculata TaxID=3917 RepID=A0A4D6LFL7_VIGUN|nr:hypothetical protein DEO72_LG3g1985 [Vigna unguiculata]